MAEYNRFENQDRSNEERRRRDWYEQRNRDEQYRQTGYGSQEDRQSDNIYNESYNRQQNIHYIPDHDERDYGSVRNDDFRTGNDRSGYGNTSYRNHLEDNDRSNRGKGPRGYQRSKERIMEDVCDRLTVDDRLDASDIEVNVENNEVVLTGTVTSRDAKRRAEDLAESIPGVQNVENRLKIVAPEPGHTETMNTIIRNKGNMEDQRNRSV